MKTTNHATLAELKRQANEMQEIIKTATGPEKDLYTKLLAETEKTTAIKEARKYLKMYFEFNTELRTICNEETNIVTKKDLDKYSEEDIICMAEEARYDVRSQIGYLID